MSPASPNINIAWCQRLVDNLVGRGVQTFFVSPGYRDAPLIAALTNSAQARLVSCMDERVGAYMALGLAKATGCAAALVCTSGTAAANYLPAVIEAATEQIPMLVLSCDRPVELTFTGANQAIDHSSFFGSYGKDYMSLPTPEGSITPQALDALMSVAYRSCYNYPRGVVHINIPLRGRLEPVEEVHQKIKAFDERPIQILQQSPSILNPHEQEISRLEKDIAQARRGLLVIGRLHNRQDIRSIYEFSQKLNWPVYADINSSLALRMDRLVDLELPFGCQFLEHYKPDLVVQLGSHVTSKYLDLYFENRIESLSYRIFSQDVRGQNPAMTPALHIAVNHFTWLDTVKVKSARSEVQRGELHRFKAAAQDCINEAPLSMPWVAKELLKSGHSQLFLGNSSTIRAFDTWVFQQCNSAHHQIFANRGASGIEGLLATAMGVAIGTRDWVDLVLGDVSMIHDLNSLLQLVQLDLPVRIFCLNNNGGGIFTKLPIGEFPKLLNPYIATPHSFDFSSFCQGAGLDYIKITDKKSWTFALNQPLDHPRFFEVVIPVDRDQMIYDTLKQL